MAEIDDRARSLAQQFLKDGVPTVQLEFGIEGSSDRVVVTVTRTAQEKKVRLLKRLAENTISFQAPGGLCPTCSGTGRI